MTSWILLFGCAIVCLALVCWAIVKCNCTVRVLVVFFAIIVAVGFGYSLGESVNRLKNYDQYIYRFSQYSTHLRDLAEHQQIARLTNEVILFDERFNPRQDPGELQDVMLRILKLGKYYETGSNAPTARNY